MKSYALGLDLGIASIGWAIGPIDNEGNVMDVERLGTFCYPSPVAEVKKGRRTTNRSNRGAKRRARHRLTHFKARRSKLLRELVDSLRWWPSDPAEQARIRSQKLRVRDGKIEPAHPVALKVKGLRERLDPHELACIFLHYQRHRGYLSTADLPTLLRYRRPPEKALPPKQSEEDEQTEQEKEIRGLNNCIKSTRELLDGRTISEFQLDVLERRERPSKTTPAIRARLIPPKRQLDQSEDLKKLKQTPATDFRYDRWMYIEEFDRIWRTQAESYPEMTAELRAKIEALIFHQDPLESKDGAVGACEILPTYRRCRVGELVFQRHRILAFLAHTKLNNDRLTPAERQAALEFLIVRDKSTYGELRQALGAAPESRFDDEPLPAPRGPRGRGNQAIKAAGRDMVKGSVWGRQISQALNLTGSDLASGAYDDLVHDLISLPEVARYPRLTEAYGISDEDAVVLMGIEPPNGYAKRCSRVLRRIEPHLFSEDDLHNATRAAGYATADQRPVVIKERLEVAPDWTTGNPSVDAAVRWSAKVINQIIERYGKPAVIRVELPRQMAMGNEQRAKEWKRINERADKNDAYSEMLDKAGLPASRKNLMRLQLAAESNWRSPYEPDREIGCVEDLVANYDLDHIVPQSYSAEDGLSNLVLCPTALNDEKRARTPFEAFGPPDQRWDRIAAFVKGCHSMPRRKRERILAQNRPEQGMEARMLTQMGYVGTQVTVLLRQLNVPCHFVNGAITAEIRRRYGLDSLLPSEPRKAKLRPADEFGGEKNRADLRHHAIDAATVLLVDYSMAQRITRLYKALEEWRGYRQKGEKPTITLEEPFPGVRERLRDRLNSIPVVRPPIRRSTGPLHKETLLPLQEFELHRGSPESFEANGRHVLRYGSDGRVTGAWLKDTVHHGRIFALPSGKRHLVSVSLFEIAKIVDMNGLRKRNGRRPLPLIDRTPPNPLMRFVMSLSNGDTVDYQGDKGAGPGLYRIGTIAVGESFEISMFPIVAAKSEPKAPGSVRIRSVPELNSIRSRVTLNIFGEVIRSEPASDD